MSFKKRYQVKMAVLNILALAYSLPFMVIVMTYIKWQKVHKYEHWMFNKTFDMDNSEHFWWMIKTQFKIFDIHVIWCFLIAVVIDYVLKKKWSS